MKSLMPAVKRSLLSPPSGSQNLRLTIEMTPTQTLDDWRKREPQMRTMFACNRIRIDEIDARRVAVNVFYNDPLTDGMSPEWFRELLNGSGHTWRNTPIGVDEDGNVKVRDWVTLPHWLIGGTTNAGKSVLVNTAIASILTAREGASLVLVDPKKVEFADWVSVASAHATEDSEMVDTLNQVVDLMERRYAYMAHHGIKTLWDDPLQMELLGGPVAVVVDEVADLLDASGKEAGTPIARLAQKGRAAAIHILLATQNPRADLFGTKTGTQTLKANMTDRAALRTGTTSESNIILGDGTAGPSSGADASTIGEHLPGTAIDKFGRRFRCPYLSAEFIKATVAAVGPAHSLSELASKAQFLELSEGDQPVDDGQERAGNDGQPVTVTKEPR